MAPPVQNYHKRAIVLVGFKAVLLCLIVGFLTYEIIRCAINYKFYQEVWKYLGQLFPLYVAAILMMLVVEVGMMILLVKAIRQKSFYKSRLWLCLAFAFFGVHLCGFSLEACVNGWGVATSLFLIELFFELIAIKIMYDFMAKVRNRRSHPPPVPRSQPPALLPPNVEVPMTTFKMNDLSANPYRPTTTTDIPTHRYTNIAPWNMAIAAQLRSSNSGLDEVN